MRRARDAILAHGGAGTTNVFTRILLALHGVIPWAAVPMIPVEIMFLPRWFPFHLSRISYWGRTVLVPLLVLQAMKPSSRNPRGVQHRRTLSRAASARAPRATGSASVARRGSRSSPLIDALMRLAEPYVPAERSASAPSTRPSRSSPSG